MKVFRDYAEVNEKIMEGYTVAAVTTGINEYDTGMLLELERKVDNVILGIDVVYGFIKKPVAGKTGLLLTA